MTPNWHERYEGYSMAQEAADDAAKEEREDALCSRATLLLGARRQATVTDCLTEALDEVERLPTAARPLLHEAARLAEALAEVERLRAAGRPLLHEAARLVRGEYLPEPGANTRQCDQCTDDMAQAGLRLRDIHDAIIHRKELP